MKARSSNCLVGSPTDEELVVAVGGGDDAAFAELYRRYYAPVKAYVRSIVRDPYRAEDTSQEVFLSALRRLRASDAEIVFKPWIYRIARNASIDLLRLKRFTVEVPLKPEGEMRVLDQQIPNREPSQEAAIVRKEQLGHLRGALTELSEMYQRLLVMRELEGRSYREIGTRLRLTRSAVESALFRARRQLRANYGELSSGRRCVAVTTELIRMARGTAARNDRLRISRHLRACEECRRFALRMGLEVNANGRAHRKLAPVLPGRFPRWDGDPTRESPESLVLSRRAAARKSAAGLAPVVAASGTESVASGLSSQRSSSWQASRA
jgi:RNA polymerase sigma factor (sigma-70 family)